MFLVFMSSAQSDMYINITLTFVIFCSFVSYVLYVAMVDLSY